mgnify:CR=1 FL=1
MIALAICGFVIAGLCGTFRLLIGPSLADRIIALDVTLVSLMGAITVDAARVSASRREQHLNVRVFHFRLRAERGLGPGLSPDLVDQPVQWPQNELERDKGRDVWEPEPVSLRLALGLRDELALRLRKSV